MAPSCMKINLEVAIRLHVASYHMDVPGRGLTSGLGFPMTYDLLAATGAPLYHPYLRKPTVVELMAWKGALTC